MFIPKQSVAKEEELPLPDISMDVARAWSELPVKLH